MKLQLRQELRWGFELEVGVLWLVLESELGLGLWFMEELGLGLWLFETPSVTWAEESRGRQQGVLRLRHLQRGHAVEEVDHWTQQILTASCSKTLGVEIEAVAVGATLKFNWGNVNTVRPDSPELGDDLPWKFCFDSVSLDQWWAVRLKSCSAAK